jgi:hypothetical protein
MANAGLINYSGTFHGSNPAPTSAVTSISGSWSFAFDDSVVTGGSQGFETTLTAFSLSPNPLGATLFDATNTRGYVRYVNGVLGLFGVGAVIGGVDGVSSLFDDFLASYYPIGSMGSNGTPASIYWSLASEPATISGATVRSGSYIASPQSVPEPDTLLLVGAGLIGLWLLRWRRRTV